jgi:hypothetical protein
MTSHVEAPGDTGVERAWKAYDDAVDALGSWHDSAWLDAVRKEREKVEAAVRAQMDEEVQRLVEAARRHQEECCYCCAITQLDAALEPFQATTVEEGRSDA